ncbi:MAG: YfhO family protein [Lachnospiraceae bacterium]|nr:YfhO family protein [Lachnospiraceae bacterium]
MTGKRRTNSILVFGIAMLSLLVVYALEGFYPFGRGSIVALDLYSQYTPILYRFYDVVKGVKNIAVDFHIGGGRGVFNDTLCELINPFNYILLLFPREKLYLAVNLLMPLYGGAASLTAYFALDRICEKEGRRSGALQMILALAYGMSYYVAYQYEIIRWMYIVVLFPLYYLALRRLIEEGRSVVAILLLAYILMLNVQFGFQICLFTAVYATCRIWEMKKQGSGEIAAVSLRIIMLAITSVLISGISVIPNIINLADSARSVQTGSILTVMMHHGLDNIAERFLEISSPITLGIIIAAVIVLRRDLKKLISANIGSIVCLLIMLLTVISEPANLMWHLGSYQCFPVRYGYIVLWLQILLSDRLAGSINDPLQSDTEQTDKKEESSAKIKNIINICVSMICVLPALAACVYIFKNRLKFAQAFATLDISVVCPRETLALYVILIADAALVAVIFAMGKKAWNKTAMIMICVLAGMSIELAVFLPQSSPARAANEKAFEDMTKTVVSEKSEWYTGHAADNDEWPRNAALITGQYSMTSYMPSGEGLKYAAAMKNLGYETPWIAVTSNGGSEVSDRFLGIGNPVTGAPAFSADAFNRINGIYDMDTDRYVPFWYDNKGGNIGIKNDGSYDAVILPVAYVRGWKCRGGELFAALDGFVGIKPEGGTDDIIISYHTPGLGAGIVLSVLGLILMAFMIRGKETRTNKAAVYIYRTAVILLVIVIYILPNLGMAAYMGAKALGHDYGDALESFAKKNTFDKPYVLLSEQMEDDGLHVLIGRDNLMMSEKVKISASSIENNSFKPSKVADGDRSKASRWSSANDWDNNEHLLTVEFEGVRNISAVKIYWERNNACAYTVEISDDGKEWSVAKEFDSQPQSNPQTIYFERNISGKYLRLHVTDVVKHEEDATLYYQNVSVNELEVYSDECDSFVIAKPKLTAGYDREIPVPEVMEGYSLYFGGINYGNLAVDGRFADTVSDVEINLGYILRCGNYSWDLQGFDLVLPASEPLGTVVKSDIGSYDTEIKMVVKPDIGSHDTRIKTAGAMYPKEWKPGNGIYEIPDYEEAIVVLDRGEFLPGTKLSTTKAGLGREGYEIVISDGNISICAETEEGCIRAATTLKHMLANEKGKLPCGTLRDYPEYEVRGFVLDVARRPIETDMLYAIVDDMADNYMNTLQLHFNDNDIISSSGYDKTVAGARELYSAFRLESDIEANGQKLTSEDLYYTDEEIKALTEYAEARGVRIVPEIDTPAHCMSLTKLFPEMGYDAYPEMADTLDVSKPEVLELTTSIWRGYLTGGLFDECETIHIGADEFYGDNEAYAAYLNGLVGELRSISPDKNIRLWGSFTYNDVDMSGMDNDLEVMIWNPFWADPEMVYGSGMGVINCLNKDLYIIPGGGNDRLDIDHLANEWEPNVFKDGECDETLPAWSDRMLGACYSMWNDHYRLGNAPDEAGLMERIEEPMSIISRKLW